MLVLLLTLLPVRAQAAQQYTVDGAPSQVGYYVEHVVGFSSGQFLKFNGTVQLSNDNKSLEKLELTVDVDSLSTYDEERDHGLKGPDFLNVEQYPQFVIKSSKISKDKVTAQVTIRGITKEAVFDYTFYGVETVEGAPKALLVLQGKLDRRDFGADYNVQSEKTGKDLLGTEFEVTLHLMAAPEK
jgi:polyisoprenoid-binding protein YceI